jgi:hypothetical protein
MDNKNVASTQNVTYLYVKKNEMCLIYDMEEIEILKRNNLVTERLELHDLQHI